MAVKNYSAQGSITIKRLRTGDNLFISFDNNGIPLYQGVNTDTTPATVTPDWSQAANQPMLTPKVTSARNALIELSQHEWDYNGVALVFNGAALTGGFTKDSTGKFAMNATTGALKIIDNLASAANYANDQLDYRCLATVDGVQYRLSKSADIFIQKVGATSYIGLITATTETLTASVENTTLKTDLKLAGNTVASWYTKWYKGNLDTPWTEKNGQNTITVGRADVNGTVLFIAEFYLSAADATSGADPVFRAGIRIMDATDDFQIVYAITSANKTVDTNKPVVVTGQVVNMRTNTVVNIDGTWKTYVMDKNTWQPTQTVNSNTVTVTTADTDTDAGQNDVEVTGNVTWTE